MSFAAFGPGIIIVTRTDIPGTPVNVGFAQELSIDIAGETKQLYGQNQFPLVAARGTIKATGKLKAAEISAIMWNNCFYGMSGINTGGYQWNVSEGHAVAATNNTKITVTQTGFDQDLGVVYASGALAGVPLAKVTSASPVQGQYSLNAGGSIYLFASADNGASMAITYTSTVTVGQNIIIANQPIGTTPTFQLDYYTNLNQPQAAPFVVRIFSCIGSKHTMAFKLTDFMMPELDFEYFANVQGNILEYVFPEVS